MTAPDRIRNILLEGQVIPAHPLALTPERTLDDQRQRGLTRYYLDAGAGGLAVGVHTTQFEIHREEVGLYGPVLELAMNEARRCTEATGGRHPVMIAGLVGETEQATSEAKVAKDHGYDCGLLSLASFEGASDEEMIRHLQAVAEVLPVFGFYLQEEVGGRALPYSFWRRFVEIDRVVAVKTAPFDRYRTQDVVRAVADSGRADEIALYTGNDDHIVQDLLTTFPFGGGIRFAGGLLGQWACWTRKAVELLERIKRFHRMEGGDASKLLELGEKLTDANAAIFDAGNRFAGCLPGIHEVLRRQGLLDGRWCLDPDLTLSPGQKEEIDRIFEAYPELRDDEFVEENRKHWLSQDGSS